MKQSFKLSLIALLLSNMANAANPVQGWYAGIMLGASSTPALKFNTPAYPVVFGTTTLPTIPRIPGKLSYKVFGNIGGQVGYRFMENFRAEMQIFGNSNNYSKLTLGPFTYAGDVYPAIVIGSPKTSTGLRMKGSTTTGAFMVNGFYDFYTPGGSDFSPYLGLGVGYAHIMDKLKFYYNNVYVSGTTLKSSANAPNVYVSGTTLKSSANAPAVQAIIGAGYFMDDFTWVGLDYRYFTTKTIQDRGSRLQINTINLSISGMFCA